MQIRIRTHPIDIFLLTGDEAKEAREVAGWCEVHGGFVFVTGSFGYDGFVWGNAEEFETDWQISFGKLDHPSTAATVPATKEQLLDNLRQCVIAIGDELDAAGPDAVAEHPVLAGHKIIYDQAETLISQMQP